MKYLSSIFIILIAVVLFSCSNGYDPSIHDLHKETGTVQVTVNLGEAGKLNKAKNTAAIDMANLVVTLSADGQDTINDTLSLTGGSQERTERMTYAGLAAWVNDRSVEWMLSATALDRNGLIIHSGDTIFTLPVGDTVEIPLFLNAFYSMLVANYFPLRDSVTLCELRVDGYLQADSSFPKQSLVGDTVTLSFDYLTASPSGISHHIELNVYGEIAGNEEMLYTGDTTINVLSGEDAGYMVVLSYVGSDTINIASTIVVTLGKVGTVTVNGTLTGNSDRYYLMLTGNGNGTVSGSDSVTSGILHAITAIPDSGYSFKVWRVTNGNAVITDSTSDSTTVTLENGDATVEGVFINVITFQKTYGGAYYDYGYSVQQTTDGGYVITGYTLSYMGDNDVYLIKTTATGDTLWTKTYGDGDDDVGYSVQQTSDGGFIITGSTFSFETGKSDVYSIKTTATGDAVWTKTYGGNDDEWSYSVQQTSDGGFIIAGETSFFGAGNRDLYLIKTTATGDTLWTKTYGGTGYDYGYSVQQTTDGGFIVAGATSSFGAGNRDLYLVKTTATGDTLWTKTYGGTGYDYGYSVQQTSDGGFIIAGETSSFGAGNRDLYLVKTTVTGDALWTKTFGGTGYDYGYSVQQTTDGGFIITGETSSFGAGNRDLYLVKTTATGDALWTKTFGGTQNDYGKSVQQTSDGGYIITGTTLSFGTGGVDLYLIKTDENGIVETMQ
jgi:hypothetical protein